MPVDLEGLEALVVEYHRKALMTAKMYANSLARGEFVMERDWPRIDEADRIENLAIEAYRERFGVDMPPPTLWNRRAVFLRMFRDPTVEMTSSAEFSKSFEERALWAQSSLDLVRYLKVRDSTPRGGLTTILFLCANPTNEAQLRLEVELREIREEVERAKLRDSIDLVFRGAVRAKDLSRALVDLRPHVVHFSGHGSRSGSICLEDETGRTHEVGPEALAALFALVKPPIPCVVLNACYSELVARAISKHVTHVVGMKNEIGDRAAIAYAAGFYRALAAGKDIEDSHRFGLVELKLHNIAEDDIPVLLSAQS